MPWHPGFNELGLTTCSKCGPFPVPSINQQLKQADKLEDEIWGVASASPDRRWRPIRLALSKKHQTHNSHLVN